MCFVDRLDFGFREVWLSTDKFIGMTECQAGGFYVHSFPDNEELGLVWTYIYYEKEKYLTK